METDMLSKKELLSQIEGLYWYKEFFDFMERNYKSIKLSSKFSDSEIEIEDSGVVIGPKFRLDDSLVKKEFESIEEVCKHLMQWYDTDKQLCYHRNIEDGAKSIIVTEEDGFQD